MVLWTKLWYDDKTMELLFTKEKNMGDYQRLGNFRFIMEKPIYQNN